MVKSVWIPLAALLVAGLGLLTAARARGDEEEEQIKAAQAAAADVAKLADAANDPDELKKLAQAVARKYDDLGPIMGQMKPAAKGGMMIGKPGAFPADSAELALLQLAKKPPRADQMAAQAAELTRLAEVIRGIAEMPPYYATKYAPRPRVRDRWNALAGDMSEWGHELLVVVKKNDADSLRKVVTRLSRSCNDCHTAFRDDGTALYDVEQATLAVNNPEKLQAEAAALVRTYSLEKLSWTFRLREKGGLGVGPKPGDSKPGDAAPVFVPYPIGTKPGDAPPKPAAVLPDGIEAQLGALEQAPPTAAQLAARPKDLQHMAEVVRVLAEATPGYSKEYASNEDARKKWSGFSDDMRQGSDDLIAAVKANDVQSLRKALGKLNQSCTDCHAKFRDN